MPTYGYHCPSCSTDFDVWQRMSDKPGANCPRCGAPARRLFFPAGIVFKGAGFYATDNRSRSGGDGASSSSSGAGTKSGEKTPPVEKKQSSTGGESSSSSTPATAT